MSSEHVKYRLEGDVARIDLDDGKANALSPEVIAAIEGALDRAESESRAVVIAGREGRFSAGFDLSHMTSSPDSARELVTSGAAMLMRIYMFPQPVVAACTGHALAAGAILLLAADTRIGADGDFKIGLNEVAIGMRLPIFGVELARDRLSKRHFTQSVVQARIYSGAEAVDAGYLDMAIAPENVVQTAMAEAERLGELRTGAYGQTKAVARADMVERVRATLAEDMARVAAPAPSKG
jgi:enoyl-CoA hydratase